MRSKQKFEVPDALWEIESAVQRLESWFKSRKDRGLLTQDIKNNRVNGTVNEIWHGLSGHQYNSLPDDGRLPERRRVKTVGPSLTFRGSWALLEVVLRSIAQNNADCDGPSCWDAATEAKEDTAENHRGWPRCCNRWNYVTKDIQGENQEGEEKEKTKGY